jgi:hypothetical protein
VVFSFLILRRVREGGDKVGDKEKRQMEME